LEAALRAGNIPGPYVLVGHSMGGYDVRMYANLHRSNVVGMVLVDPSIDGNDGPLNAAVPTWVSRTSADEESAMKCIRATAAGQMKAGDPLYVECGSPPPGSAMASPQMAGAVLSERDSLDASSSEVSATQIRYGGLPLVVLTAGGKFSSSEGWSTAELEALRTAWREGHRRIARFSELGTERVVDDAPHVIHIAKPEAVIEAVGEVIKEAR
jgi:pimeloyl-ACP methyl ester carboxylesterase